MCGSTNQVAQLTQHSPLRVRAYLLCMTLAPQTPTSAQEGAAWTVHTADINRTPISKTRPLSPYHLTHHTYSDAGILAARGTAFILYSTRAAVVACVAVVVCAAVIVCVQQLLYVQRLLPVQQLLSV